jgi:NAD(P)-dependent dehydrogenase (short-subunit alcohol dehydrogenase family)
MTPWTVAQIPSQAGRTSVVTGAASGLGFQDALALARAGANVIVADRDVDKAREAVDMLRAVRPDAQARFEPLDLSSLKSVAEFAERLAAEEKTIDLLINNAGIMSLPKRRTTAEGFEMQLGVNYLGHFALTARLLPLLRRGRQPRVVCMSSTAYRFGAIHLDDLQLEHGYDPEKAYSQSKLAVLMFAFELQRRSDANGWGLMSLAAHPGWARTNLLDTGPGAEGKVSLLWRAGKKFQQLWCHSAADGALSALFAATSPEAQGGGYYGPGGFLELKGSPAPARIKSRAKDAAVAAKLWEVSERLTGTSFVTD